MIEILNPTPSKLVNYNPRAEKHGQKRKPAATLRLECAMPAHSLEMFSKGMHAAMYEPAEDQADLANPDRNALTKRRFPKMSSYSMAFEGKGYVLTVDYGIGGDSNIVLDEATVKDIRITLQENGVYLLSYSVNCAPNERDSGILDHRIQQEITITLKGPEPQTAGELFGDEPKQPAAAEA